MIVDTHAHLTYAGLKERTSDVLERARGDGVDRVITVGIDVDDSARAVELAERSDNVWATVGVHPHDATSVTGDDLDRLGELARSEKVVAWGEMGLDFFRDRSPRDVQKKIFREQLVRAKEQGLPVVIHDRDAHADCLEILKAEADDRLRGVFHCFSGDLAFAREVLALGFYISIPGTVTYPKNDGLRKVVEGVKLERCLLETDCPFLSPQPKRGKTNEPAYILHTAREVSRIKGLSLEDVGRITSRAAEELFGIGEHEPSRVVYPIRDSLYINLTGRCTNRCSFCAKYNSRVVKGHDLEIRREPGVEEVMAEIERAGGVGSWSEIVFCGFGEPLLRLDAVKDAAYRLKKLGCSRVRINTDGLANLVHGRDVTAELTGLVDVVSVSLNAPDAATYEKLCRPTVENGYEAVLAFLAAAKKNIPEVSATAVAVPGVDIEACRHRAEELGVGFRVREYNEVG